MPARKSTLRPSVPVASDGKQTCKSTGTAADFVPESHDWKTLHDAAEKCRGCSLYCDATQVVFGEGPTNARAMMIGEQPGDREDLAGRPFVGPAGQLLDEAMQQAGLDRAEVYVTNAVKHFKFEKRGTRRLHVKPSARETTACRPWLEAEIKAIQPEIIVCLGATAAQALLGKTFRVTQQRGEILETPWAPQLLATIHPSALLRIPDEAMREQSYAQFVDDLRTVVRALKLKPAKRARA